MTDAAKCEGKVRFDSAKLAHAVIKRRRRSKSFDRPGYPYRCRVCGFWHIGNVKTDQLTKRKGAPR